MKESFFALVRKMRENQKEYFRTRHPSYLENSRKLEKQVDAELDRLDGSLFGGQVTNPDDVLSRVRDFVKQETATIAKMKEISSRQGYGASFEYFQGQESILQELGKIIGQ